MPSGIIKTPNAVKAKDGNLTKSADRTGSGGKKLVQTRLPFKLLAPAASSAEAASSSPSAASVDIAPSATADDDEEAVVVSKEPRKRKLSYGSDDKECDSATEGVAQQRRSNSKENLAVGVAATTAAIKKLKTAVEAVADDVIELIDDDDDEDEVAELAPKRKEKQKPEKAVAAGKNESSSGSHSPLIQIKLPMKNNKRGKRRKSLKKTEVETVKEAAPAASKKVAKEVEASCSSDDVEALALELNPQKRLKVAENQKKAAAKLAAEEEEEPKPATECNEKKEETVMSKVEPKDKPEEKSEEPKAKLDDKLKEPKAQLDKKLKAKAKDVEEQPNASDLDSDCSAMDVDEDDTNKTSPENDDQQQPKRQSLAAAAQADATSQKSLTPKQQKLLDQRRKARDEKERKLQEERRQKQQEKEERELAKKKERDEKEEQRRKEKEEKEEQRRLEREDKERKRQAEVDSKNEEKRKRNEAKEEVQRKKDEERRRKDQEKEEAELKKKRAAASFTSFFVQKQPKGSANYCDPDQSSCDSTGHSSNAAERKLAFRPFQIKDDMLLAPTTRGTLAKSERAQLDGLCRHKEEQDEEDDDEEEELVRRKPATRAQLYLSDLRLGRRQPQRRKRDVKLDKRPKDDDEDDDVQVIDDLSTAGTPIVAERPKQQPRMRTKYLHFADNRRPPYYGTWRKRSQLVTPRRPLAQDKSCFDYEVDSDCEWEEEEPGESLSASEDEKERESEEEDYEVDNEWFVPHGHLSDEELQNDDDEDGGEMEDGNTREAQKAKLQVLQQEFAQEMKSQTKKIKPRLLGPVWLDENGQKSLLCPAVFVQTIDMYASWQLEPLTLEPPPESPRAEELPEERTTLTLDEPLLQQLVRLIHGNSNSKVFLISEYLEFLKPQAKEQLLPSKTLLREKFDEFGDWKSVELSSIVEPNAAASTTTSTTTGSSKKAKKPKKRLCWVVNDEVLAKFELSELTLQNQWSYTLTPKKGADTSLREEATAEPPLPPATPLPEAVDKVQPDITKFTTAVVAAAPVSPSTSTTTGPAPAKKRATLLMSVPRDQQFHTATKNALISQYLKKQSDAAAASVATASKKPPPQSPSQSPTPVDDVVLLSD